MAAGPPAAGAKMALRGVSKVFAAGSAHEVVAIERIDLEVRDGEIYCLLGPSGCGKTTVLNMVAGFEAASAGEVLVDGATVAAPGPDRAVVFQEATLFPWLTVLGNIAFGLRLAAVDGAAARERAMRYVESMGLKGFEHRYPYELSGGMQQRVSLARAWVNNPAVLLLDEPFGALDAQTKIVMQELLLELWERFHTTILYITHDVEEAIFLGDRIGVMTKRPSRLRDELVVDVPRPRTIDLTTEDRFVALKRRILNLIRDDAALR